MQQQQLYGFTHDIIEEGTSVGDITLLDGAMLHKLKPMLKKNQLHLGNNAIVTWKSFEIWMI